MKKNLHYIAILTSIFLLCISFPTDSQIIFPPLSVPVTLSGIGLGVGVEEKILKTTAPTNPSITIDTNTGTSCAGALVYSYPTSPYAWIVECLPPTAGLIKLFRIDDANTVHLALKNPLTLVATQFDVGQFGATASTGKFNVINDLAATYPLILGKAFAAQSGDLIQIQDSAAAVTYKINSAGQTLAPNGSLTVPTYSFINDPTTGIYFSTGNLKFAVGGADQFRMLSNVILPVSGTLSLGGFGTGFNQLYLNYTNTATVGAVTMNKPSGRVNIAATGTSVVVTNSLVTAASHVMVVASTADTTARVTSVVPAAGSFTINTVAVTAQTSFDFVVFNAD